MIKKILRRILFSRVVRVLISTLDGIVLPGFKGFSLYKIGHFFIRALRNGSLITRASAISFKLFMAFFPMIIMLLTLIPFIPIADLQDRILVTFNEVLPSEVYTFIEGTLKDLVKKRGTLLSFSFLVVLWLASNSMNAILAGFSHSTNLTKTRGALIQRLMSIGLLIILSLMLFLAVLIITTSDAVFIFLHEHGISLGELEQLGLAFAKWAVVIFLIGISISLLFSVGDTEERKFQLLSPGVLLSTVLIIIASQLLAYMFNNITDYNALYGSIGAIIAVQIWIYVNVIILLVGFELDTSIDKAKRLRASELRLQENKEK